MTQDNSYDIDIPSLFIREGCPINNDRRAQLDQALTWLTEAVTIIEAAAQEERHAFLSLPPGFRQDHCSGRTLELIADWLDGAAGSIKKQITAIHCAQNATY